jgi:filamentous hemagglutinin
MNQGIYRLVFNQARGLLMVVGELASNRSKGGTSGAASRSARFGQSLGAVSGKPSDKCFTLSPLRFALLLALGQLTLSSAVFADILIDRSAPADQRATVLNSANGVPQVNIQTPTAAGVSRNQYTQFDVDNNGAILNNSRHNVSTQLGGMVSGNPNLIGGTARVIVNQVNSTHPSLMNGFVEVAGSRAQVVFSNPAGISCSGCGFINAHRATLTTGTPVYQNGDLYSYRVEGGAVSINGAGLDASTTEFTHIIARSVEVNAGIWANDLAVVAGTNDVAATTSVDVTERSSAGTTSPNFAIDVSALGGMYANKIHLVGTEDGVGVRHAGEIGAGLGGFTLSADGRVENTGQINSTANIAIHTSGDVDNTGTVYAGKDASITSALTINQTGIVAAYDEVSLTATGHITSNATSLTVAGIDDNGVFKDPATPSSTPATASTITLEAQGNIDLQGQQIALDDLNVTGENITLDNNEQDATRIDMTAVDGDITISNSTSLAESFSAQGESVAITDSQQAVTQATITATQNDIDLTGTTLSTEAQLSLNAAQAVVTDTANVTAETLTISATSLSNRSGQLLQSGTDSTSIDLAGDLDNTSGRLESNGALSLTAKTVLNQSGRLVSASNLTLSSDETLSNQQGEIISGAQLTLASGVDTGSGSTSGVLNNDQGLIQSAGSAHIDTHDHALINTNSGNTDGIVSGDTLTINASTLTNNAGYVGAVQALTITTTGDSSNQAGVIESAASVTLDTAALDNDQGRLESNGDMTINTHGHVLTNTASLIRSGGHADITVGTLLNNTTQGTDQGLQADSLSVTASDTIDNTDGAIRTNDNLTLTAATSINNTRGLVSSANHNVTLQATDLANNTLAVTNTDGTLIAGQTLAIDSHSLTGDGNLYSEGDIDIQLSSNYTHTGELIANGTAKLHTTGNIDHHSMMAAGQLLDLQAATIDTQAGSTFDATSLKLNATDSNTFNNRSVINGTTIAIDTITLNNLGTGRIYGDTITLAATTINNHAEDGQAPVIAARNELDIGVGSLSNTGGALIYSDGDLSIGGAIVGGQATGTATTVTNDQSIIEAVGALDITATTINNLGGDVETTTQSTTESAVSYSLNAFNNTHYDASQVSTRTSEVLFATTPSGDSDNFFRFDVTRTTTQDVISRTDPASIRSGQGMTLTGTVNNTNSDITAGGTLTQTGVLNNSSETGVQRISEDGTFTEYFRIHKKHGHDKQGTETYGYSGPNNLTRIEGVLATTTDDGEGSYEFPGIRGITRVESRSERVEGDDGEGGTSFHWVQYFDAYGLKQVEGSAITTTINLESSVFRGNTNATEGFIIDNGNTQSVSETAPLTTTAVEQRQLAQFTEITNNTGAVRSSNAIATPSNNSLFIQDGDPTATYLIETDPLFIDNRTWLSSAYVTQQVAQSPEFTNKRLGDGFYEQRIVRDQIVALTGRRFLDNYTDDDTQYQDLLDSGIAFAQAHSLRPGITLGEAQMANLTTDMVWLEAQDVQLADGSTQQVLVPKLYAVVQPNNLLPSGALLSGDSIDIQGDELVNSGQLIARARIDIDVGKVSDTGGRLQAAAATINATTDAILEGSDWRVDDDLSITAGRDIAIRTQSDTVEYTNENSSSRTTTAGRRATITVGTGNSASTLNILAGRNASLTGATLNNQGTGDTTLRADNDLTLDTVIETTDIASTHARGKRVTRSSQTEITTTISGQGNVSLQAGSDLHIRGGDVSAAQALTLDADNISLTTAENRSNSRVASNNKQTEANDLTHDGVNLQAGTDLTLTALNDLEATGANASAGNDLALNAGGDTTIEVAQDERYRYEKTENKKSWGRKTTTLKESYTTTNVGGEFEAGNNLTINSTINPDDSVTANATSGDVTIVGSDLSAENQVAIAGDSVTIADKKEVTFTREETFKRGWGGLSNKSTGKINRAELIQATEIVANQQNLDLISASNIAIIGSNLRSGEDINLTAVDDIVITADRALAQAQEWSKETKFLSSLSSVYSREDKLSGSTTSTVVASEINAGNNVTINAGRARVVGSDILAGNDVNVTTDIGDIVVESAQSTSDSYSNETTVKVSMTDIIEQATDVNALADSFSDGQATMSIAKVTYDKIDTQTNATAHRASQLLAKNNVSFDSVGDIAITGSDIIADADNNQQGDATLVAGGDVTIKETADISDTQIDEVHGKGEISVVVQHQAIEIVKAAKAVKDARDQVKTAKEDYRKYKKDLEFLKVQRDQLQTDYNNKVPGLLYEDIIDLNSLIDEVESDKEWYQAGIALAAISLASKITLLVQQSVAGAASVVTFGFNAGVQIDLEASKTETDTHSEVSRGSVLAGNNINIQTGNNGDVTQTATHITGSHLQASEDITIATGELTVEASRDENSFNTKNEQASIRIAQTVYGTVAGGPTVSASYSRSKAKSGDTTYNNSTLNADNITLSSTGDTTIKGANIKAEDTLTLNVGEDLIVQSKQNRYNANNKSFGVSAGFSLGKGGTGDSTTASGAAQNLGKTDGSVSSVNGGLNASNGRSRTKKTVLTDLIGETVNINVGDNTALIGATIAAKDADGKDNGQLSLTTDTFDFGDLSNTSYSSSRSAGISTNINLNSAPKPEQQSQSQPESSTATNSNAMDLKPLDDNDNDDLGKTKLTYGASNSYSKSKTLATLGKGVINIGDDAETGEDSTERLNRDTDNTTKDLYSIDQPDINVEVEIDNALIKKAAEVTAEAVVVTAEVVAEAVSDTAHAVETFIELTGMIIDIHQQATQLASDDPILRKGAALNLANSLFVNNGDPQRQEIIDRIGELAAQDPVRALEALTLINSINTEILNNPVSSYAQVLTYGLPLLFATSATVVAVNNPELTEKIADQLFSNSNGSTKINTQGLDLNQFSHGELGAFLKEGEIVSGIKGTIGGFLDIETTGYLVQTSNGVEFKTSLSTLEKLNLVLDLKTEVQSNELANRLIVTQLSAEQIGNGLSPNEVFDRGNGRVVAKNADGVLWEPTADNSLLAGFTPINTNSLLQLIHERSPEDGRFISPIDSGLDDYSNTSGNQIPERSLLDQILINPIDSGLDDYRNTGGDQTPEKSLDDQVWINPIQDIQGPTMLLSEGFDNQLPDELSNELGHAESLGVTPIDANDKGFGDLVNSGTVIWTVDTEGNLNFGPNTVNHTVLTGGGPVISAGEAEIVADENGGYILLDINNQSGHYQPSESSLEQALDVFEKNGIK